MYGQVVRPDRALSTILDRFVCVRITKISDLDHGLFRFDMNLSFAVLFMNGDLDLYGRYGTRAGGGFSAAFKPLPGAADLASRDISRKSFRKAAERALALHEDWKRDRAGTSALVAPKVTKTYLDRPVKKPKSLFRLSRGNRCIHCHQVAEREVRHYWSRRAPVPDRTLWSFPMPERLGFSCDPDECATVKAVVPRSEADEAGLRSGDQILRLDGQPLLSIADVQWVLHQAPGTGTLHLVVARDDRQLRLTLKLREGWRRRGEFAWRYAYNELKWKILGLDKLTDVPDRERSALAIPDDESSIRIGEVMRNKTRWHRLNCNLEAWNVGVRPRDIILDVDGQGRQSQSEFMAYVLQDLRAGDKITLTVLRDGSRKRFTYPLNVLR